MALNDIVQVSITTEVAGITRVGFGTPLVASYHNAFPERARVYTKAIDMVSDGFVDAAPATGVIADPALTAVRKIFSQSPRFQRVIVGRAANQPTMAVTLIPVVQNNTKYEITINGNSASFTSDATATLGEILIGLAAAAALLPGHGTEFNAVDTGPGTSLDIDAGTSLSGMFELSMTSPELWSTVADGTPDPGVAADLTAIKTYNNDWYCLIPTLFSDPAILAYAAAIEADEKIMVACSADTDVLGDVAGNIAEDLNAASYKRTALAYNQSPSTYLNGGWAGVMLPKDPGSATWKLKTVSGAPVSDFLTTTQITNIESNFANYYTTISGRAVMQQGTSAQGQFMDHTRFIDWLVQRLREDVFAALASADKVPFTDPGIAIIENIVHGVMQEGISAGGLAADPAPVVTVPRAADVNAVDKANRLLPDVEFTAILAGAIHSVQIQGVVSV
jgi:hypothetical protein